MADSTTTELPKPTLGWVLETNRSPVPPVYGAAELLSSGTGSSPALARDGAGNIDGAALVGGVPSGTPLGRYALTSAAEATLSSGTTVVLLCGRENNWLRHENGVLLPVASPGAEWSVTKPGEWGLNLASSVSPFAVVVSGQWVYTKAPPIPSTYAHFGPEPEFPARDSNTPVCIWAFYDTTINGTSSNPEISAAYDDGAASAPISLTHAVAPGTSPLELMFNQLGADLGTLMIWQGPAAERLFQPSVRASYWNGGLRRTVKSGFQSASWNDLSITTLDPRPIASGGDAIDNARADAYPGFVRTSPFAYYSITTSPGTPFLAVRYELGNYVYQPFEYSVSFILDGTYLGYDQPWRFGTNLRSIPLPQDGRSHLLELRNGFTRGNGLWATPTAVHFGGGGFIDAVAVPKGYSVRVNRPVMETVALVLSHSVAVGELAGSVPFQSQGPQSSTAWPVEARAGHAFGTAGVVDESYGGELLANDCPTQAACASYLAAIKAAQPNVSLGFVARMLNDFYHGNGTFGECLPQYERMLQYLFTAWHTEFPGIPLYVGSDTRESAVHEAETDGCTPALKLADWRQGIENTTADYRNAHEATWLHFVDMSDWVPQNELLPGGIHPTTQGQIAICQGVAEYFHQPVVCGIPR